MLWVMLVLSLQLLCEVGQHPLLSSTMSMLPRECRCCMGLLLADEVWPEKNKSSGKKKFKTPFSPGEREQRMEELQICFRP